LGFRFGFDYRFRFDQLVVTVLFRRVRQIVRDRLAFGGQSVVGLIIFGTVAFFSLAL
jgi:hypothetical protein